MTVTDPNDAPFRFVSAAELLALEAVYAKLPTIQCKKLCYESCSIIPVTQIEKDRLFRNPDGSVTLNERMPAQCPLLDVEKMECKRWSERPLICRAFGCVETDRVTRWNMKCSHRCQPSRWMSNDEFMFRYAEICSIRGEDPHGFRFNTSPEMFHAVRTAQRHIHSLMKLGKLRLAGPKRNQKGIVTVEK